MGAAFQGAANIIRQQQGLARPGQGFQRPGVPFAPPGSPVTGGSVANRYTRTRARPVNPGGPFVPRTDLGPGVGFGPGLPLDQNFFKNVIRQLPQPGPRAAEAPTPYPIPRGGLAPISQPEQQPGGPFTPRPDLGPDVGFGPGLPQPQLEAMPNTGLPDNLVSISNYLVPTPQLEAMPYTGNPTYQSTQATQQNPNASIGFGGGIGSVFGAPFSGIGSAFTQASQQPDMSEKDTQALQGFGQAFSNLGSSFASTMGSAMPLLGGKSQPAQPGMGQANQTGPMSGGFNPSLGNTTLPGNF